PLTAGRRWRMRTVGWRETSLRSRPGTAPPWAELPAPSHRTSTGTRCAGEPSRIAIQVPFKAVSASSSGDVWPFPTLARALLLRLMVDARVHVLSVTQRGCSVLSLGQGASHPTPQLCPPRARREARQAAQGPGECARTRAKRSCRLVRTCEPRGG